MEQKAKYELAKEIADYWRHNCTDDDFYKNCRDNIWIELGENATSDEVHEIWEIIEENFLDDDEIVLHYYDSYGKMLYFGDMYFRLNMTKKEMISKAEQYGLKFIDHS